MKVFLAGTSDGSKWRDQLIPKLKIEFFNPVIENMDADDFEKVIHEREHCDYCLYVITPMMKNFFPIPEVVDDSNRRPDKTLYCYLSEDEGKAFTPHQIKSLQAVGKMINTNGGIWFKSFDDVVEFLNTKVSP